MNDKRLYKSETNKVFTGICGGIGEYFSIDPTLVRLLWLIFGFAWGGGILVYLIAIFIVPSKIDGGNNTTNNDNNN